MYVFLFCSLLLLLFISINFFLSYKFVVSNPEQPNISSQEAWEKLLKAAEDNESFDFKEALELYAKVTPDETFVSIEEKLRAANSNGRIIAFVGFLFPNCL
jgi:hypothetical protein